MKPTNLSICYYPTTILFIDDNPDFLRTLKELCIRENLIGQFFIDPKKALDFINNAKQNSNFMNRCLTYKGDLTSDHIIEDFDVRLIHKEILNSHRFEEITIAVIDYSMPTMDGLTFCQDIKKSSIKKIMLTGEADDTLAVKAFNEFAINQFLRKDSPDLIKGLLKCIKEMHQLYFSIISNNILNKNYITDLNSFVWFKDPIFINFFNDVCFANNIVEYYLMDELGSFLMLDIHGNPYWLAITNDEMMDTYHELAEDDDALEIIIQSLKDRSMIPYFYNDEDFKISPKNWGPYLHKASILEGKQRYYYAFIEKNETYIFHSKKVLSYEKFLNQKDN